MERTETAGSGISLQNVNMTWIFYELLKDYTGEHADVWRHDTAAGWMESTVTILLSIDYHESTSEWTYRQGYKSGEATQDQHCGTYMIYGGLKMPKDYTVYFSKRFIFKAST